MILLCTISKAVTVKNSIKMSDFITRNNGMENNTIKTPNKNVKE